MGTSFSVISWICNIYKSRDIPDFGDTKPALHYINTETIFLKNMSYNKLMWLLLILFIKITFARIIKIL